MISIRCLHMERINITEFTGHRPMLGSRDTAKPIRDLLIKITGEGKVVTLDFAGIESISQSFGDEILGILTREHGIEFIKSLVKVENANEAVRAILNLVVRYSIKSKVA